ncbi:MAG: helix-turn-helix domain-containing protein [Bacteroidales bacterium]|nr:helix-turn-helix domain-containing protein [Bacteroidales bacterium]
MAAILNVRRSTYGEYERGKILPPMDKMKILADYFCVSVDYLYGNTNVKSHEERQEQDAMDVARNLQIILEQLENEQTSIVFDGDDLSKDSRDLLISTLQHGLKVADAVNKTGK